MHAIGEKNKLWNSSTIVTTPVHSFDIFYIKYRKYSLFHYITMCYTNSRKIYA